MRKSTSFNPVGLHHLNLFVLSCRLKSKQWRETAILLWSIYSTWLFDPMRLMGADLIRRFFDFLDYSIFSNVIVYDRSARTARVIPNFLNSLYHCIADTPLWLVLTIHPCYLL